MRARIHRPMFDRLDARMVLDSGVSAATGAFASTVLIECGTSQGSTLDTLNNSGTGTSTVDSNLVAIPWNQMPTN